MLGSSISSSSAAEMRCNTPELSLAMLTNWNHLTKGSGAFSSKAPVAGAMYETQLLGGERCLVFHFTRSRGSSKLVPVVIGQHTRLLKISRHVLTNTASQYTWKQKEFMSPTLLHTHTNTQNKMGTGKKMGWGCFKSWCSLQPLRLKFRAEPGGERGEGKYKTAARKDMSRGWHPGKCKKRVN